MIKFSCAGVKSKIQIEPKKSILGTNCFFNVDLRKIQKLGRKFIAEIGNKFCTKLFLKSSKLRKVLKNGLKLINGAKSIFLTIYFMRSIFNQGQFLRTLFKSIKIYS